ncbi:hypothetical protein JRO89_XS08G0024800 [Xanthoceras sorbifolium]|uniref:Peroxidase n=1 Tax=Xanthoceras sorbifolium TaxID=99658 RepID=A0ABQ8HNE3_9ROSI|nr:hypothetical protein JRO89_XS08G0024800 [Xanthoceras sorbifolium]
MIMKLKSFTLFILLLQLLELWMVVLGIVPLKPAISTTNNILSKVLLPPQAYLSFSHYHSTCPDLEAIIHRRLQAWFNKDYTLAASLIRLHFHDCAVRGCDASITLNYRGSERRAKASKTLRGYRVIDDIKAEVEKKCPKTVSCADILTAAARDATVRVGGPFWEVPFGRKDGKISIAREANRLVPQGHENVTTLIKLFESQGLNELDLVVLSGSHTIGRSSCHAIQNRLYNFNGTRKADPSMDTDYLKTLKQKCIQIDNNVDLDGTTPTTFDVAYYNNLKKKKGLLSTDQSLYSNERTTHFVELFASQPSVFFMDQFAVSMVKLGNVGVLTRPNEGEIRLNCNFVNPY